MSLKTLKIFHNVFSIYKKTYNNEKGKKNFSSSKAYSELIIPMEKLQKKSVKLLEFSDMR
jgi:hypothetical protein